LVYFQPHGHKSTWAEQAQEIAAQDTSTLSGQVEHLLVWLQNPEWPGAQTVISRLPEIGWPLVPHIRTVLRGENQRWQMNMMTHLVDKLSREILAGDLEAELIRLSWDTDNEMRVLSMRILARHQLGGGDTLLRIVERERARYRSLLRELDEIEAYLRS
jgi:hypothetical protein